MPEPYFGDDEDEELFIPQPWSFTVMTEEPEVLGTLFVVRDGQAEPEEWTLLDRPILKFGFCKE